MKRCKITKKWITACLVLGMLLLPVNPLKVQAAEVMATVEGTVLSGTTSSLLLLSTKEGKMEIKMDSGTDTSECKILVTNKKIYVSVANGTDGYLHAVKLSTNAPTAPAAIDTSNTTTVSGTIGQKTTDSIIYLNTAQGEMQIKLDTTTTMNGCSVLVMGRTYYISCTRGSDAYLHAVTISDSQPSAVPANVNANVNIATMSITGTVSNNTKPDILYLSTKGGEMQFKIDSTADTSRGMIHIPGRELTVSYYHGSDAYLHAVTIVGIKDTTPKVEIDTSATMTAEGTVGGKSTENLLYLDTKQGQMELKLDAVNSLNNCKALLSGKKITVTCSRGSDAYLHAIDITANYY